MMITMLIAEQTEYPEEKKKKRKLFVSFHFMMSF